MGEAPGWSVVRESGLIPVRMGGSNIMKPAKKKREGQEVTNFFVTKQENIDYA